MDKQFLIFCKDKIQNSWPENMRMIMYALHKKTAKKQVCIQVVQKEFSSFFNTLCNY